MRSRKLTPFFPAAILLLASWAVAEQRESPRIELPRAHAHNDYHHDRPLLDALDHGFCSVEADVFLVAGQLLVAHEQNELNPSRTLQSLYLDPLRQRVQRNRGRVYPNGPSFTLLVDIKSDGRSTYEALHDVLARYSDILSRVENGRVIPGAVTVVISGNRAKERIAATSPRFASIDGRLSDLDTDMPDHLMPLISDNWGLHFRWRGEGKMPEAEEKKLRDIVKKAHCGKRQVRFWATPEKTKVWEVLYEAGVDLINTDDLAGLRRFLVNRRTGFRDSR